VRVALAAGFLRLGHGVLLQFKVAILGLSFSVTGRE